MCAAYSHEQAACEIWINLNTMNYMLEAKRDLNPHITTIRTVSSSCRCATIYAIRLWVVIWMMKINHLFWIFRAFPAHQTATFSPVLAPTILHSGVVRPPTWCRLAGFSYVVRPFARSRHPLILSGYFFSTHTFSVLNMSKNYSSMSALRNSRLTQDCRCPNDLLYKV